MTKEEYEKLLQSDYWKGYSYSLIKERNFTCEDCGRSFPNMRNMLQVHHLVYREANPWSYNPEELIVLCKECHKKRHGIYSDANTVTEEEAPKVEADNTQTFTSTYTEEMSKRYAYDNSPRKKRNWFKYVVLTYVIMYLFYLAIKDAPNETKKVETITPTEESISDNIVEEQKKDMTSVIVKKKSIVKKQETQKKTTIIEMEKPLIEQKKNIAIEHLIQSSSKISQGEKMDSITNEKQKATIEPPKDNPYKKRNRRIVIKKESTTSDIWEKINRKGF